ncbi:hypothetical protein [Aliterella atlantica]|uniref:Uncharacterized protein n=1 Tax=Aliterella atlantica CENA595 TaxID=1618023 RepID=A0A0D8ZYC6_9CYAN|nr:hypothetical protein [Aliterella atlantica]KJH72201.1 hypothetical protein UH38_09070 [Aliterella atlantica CENA595]
MAVPKFHRVLRGERGEAAKQKYLAYLNRLSPTLEDSKVGTGGNRPESKKLFLRLFNYDLPGTIFAEASATVPAWETVKGVTAVNARVKDNIAAPNVSLKFKKVKPARVIYRTLNDTSGTASTSHLTGLRYLKYNNKTISFPFGKASDTDTFAEAVAALKLQIPSTAKPRFQDEDA